MEFIFSAFAGLLLLVFLIGSFFINNNSVAADVLRPMGFPLLFSIVGLVLLVIDVAKTALKKKGEGKSAEAPKKAVVLNTEGNRRVGIIVLMLFLYMLIVNTTGFMLTTLVFVFFSTRVIGYKNLKVTAIFAVLTSALLVIVFGKIFFIALPRGQGFLRELSFYIY